MKDNAKPKAYISVTGYHKEDITSDKGLFYITFKRTGGSAEESINSVREDEKKVLKHIEQYSESTDIEIEKTTYDTYKRYKYDSDGRVTDKVRDYVTEGRILVTSDDVYAIERINNSTNELTIDGIDIASSYARYYYSEIEDLKISALDQAVENARERAETMASGDNMKIKSLRNARQGVFQINALNDYSVSYGGNFDTSSISKQVTITVNAEFIAQ